MTLMLKDLTSYMRTIEGGFGKEHEDSIIPSRAIGKEGQKWGKLGH